jgi:NhaP-type Na+/H+ or K+/H+ antiporter
VHDESLLAIGIAAFAGVVATVLAGRLRSPAIVPLLVTGVVLGEGGLGVLRPDALGDGLLALVEVAIALILFEGALGLRLHPVRGNVAVVRNLLTIGALTTFAGAVAAAVVLLDFPLSRAAVVGAILVVTGPTVVIPLLRWARPRPALGEILRWEGILIDPIGALAAVVVLELVVAGQGSSLPLAAAAYATTLVCGVGVGAAAGLLLDGAMRTPRLVEPSLREPLALATAIGAFAAAEAACKGSGLFAATVAGLVLALREPPGLHDVERFKGALGSFVLSMIFVLLAAQVRLSDVWSLGWRGVAFYVALIFVRWAAVEASTLRAPLTARDRLFLAWVAPRGVVAMTVASLSAETLAREGDPGASSILAAVVLVIVGTVVVQGFTARAVARRLGVSAPRPTTVVIVGAGSFGRSLARHLAEARRPVVLVDRNPAHLAGLEDVAGVRALAADAHDDDAMEEIDPATVAMVLAATPNDEANALVCEAFSRRAPEATVVQVPSGPWALERRERHAATRWPFAFGDRLTIEGLEGVLLGGGTLRSVRMEQASDAEALRRRLGTDFRPLVEIPESGPALLIRERNAGLRSGVVVIGVERAAAAQGAGAPTGVPSRA